MTGKHVIAGLVKQDYQATVLSTVCDETLSLSFLPKVSPLHGPLIYGHKVTQLIYRRDLKDGPTGKRNLEEKGRKDEKKKCVQNSTAIFK